MMGNGIEYLPANRKVMQIMEMIQGNPIFDDLKPIDESEIVDLALDILSILIQIHDGHPKKEGRVRLIQEIAESSNSFMICAEDMRRVNNNDCRFIMDLLSEIDTLEGMGRLDRQGLLYYLSSMRHYEEEDDGHD